MISLSLVDLVAGYSEPVVFANADITADRIGIVGENGGGKSTLLRTLGGVLSPLAGHFHLSASNASYVGHKPATFPGLTVGQCLEYWSRLLAAEREEWSHRARSALESFELLSVLDVDCARLSRGQHQLVSIAVSLASDPEVVLWDEPTSGLDRSRYTTLWTSVERMLASHPADCALMGVIFTTHIVDDLDGAVTLQVREGSASVVSADEATSSGVLAELENGDGSLREPPGGYPAALRRLVDGHEAVPDVRR
ncbi:MAG: ATP-binding cassette domain-containing protein [Actinomycetota bacterium]|nr:ATP-binding cassette domain-containing protein [Actinomycetota bacterium]